MPNAEEAVYSTKQSNKEKSISEALDAVSLTEPESCSGLSDIKGTWVGAGVRSYNDIKLVWEKQDWNRLFDVTFFNQGWIAVISYTQPEYKSNSMHSFEFHLVDLEGKPIDVPFPVFLKKPVALCSTVDGDTLGLVDLAGGGLVHINVYNKTSRGWSTKQIVSKKAICSVALMPNGEFVFGNGTDVFMLSPGDEIKWSFPLPGTHNYVPLLSTTPSGLIVVGNTKIEKVTILDSSGKELQEFPSQFLKDPCAVCTDSQSDVIVTDDANSTISLFNTKGEYIKKIMQKQSPGGMAVYKDKYLVCRSSTKLSLYEFL